MIKLIAVSKTYGKLTALGQTDLEIRKGDFIMVEGPSGSGKSTLLKILGGLIRPSTGKVFFESQDLNLLSESKLALWRRENLGFVFQQFNLIEYLSAWIMSLYHCYMKKFLRNKRDRKRKNYCG